MPAMTRSDDPDVLLLGALADPARLAIVRQLAADGAVCACDVAPAAGLSQPTLSHHLRVLREAGVVRGERRGTWIWYSLEPAAGERLAAIGGALRPGAPQPAAALGGAAIVAGGRAGPASAAPRSRVPAAAPRRAARTPPSASGGPVSR
jgi:DNA-binding transcriptional ArsR family regulator